ncbi:glycosyltransferase family 4 protein [Protaetiibacter intestinalis]|uniref:Glycosyltransferase family 1 protein n=1 Tax=Protaetiibacter intestinalis TaxID=2419774 RepID=A0A387B7J5_9MICO|nr:glycosyltransferase family 1 protein [Protaetiibacter intestinalis]AYF98327.1 glycosyltransferase family 1 protein [Protaetiibacter intestinalis]
MTTLRVTLDELAAAPYGGMARYAGELARALVATAPTGAEVVGVVPASPEADYERVLAKVPGLASLEKSALARRELAAAWRRGIARTSGTGMMHATSLLAPLGAHDRVHRSSDQVAVTMHDAIAWTAPELLPARAVSWQRAMAKRAERYADAIVVPSHAVAEELDAHLAFGDRIRVIPGAPSSSLLPPSELDGRAAELGLPERYLLTVAGTEPKKNLAELFDAVRLTRADVPLVVVGPDPEAARELADAARLSEDRFLVLGPLADEDLGLVYLRAQVYVQPSLAEGFGLAVAEALAFGLPVVHTEVPALDELTAGAAISVPLGDGLPARLAEAIDAVDGELAERLATAAGDRASAFSWRDSAEKVWQLHADL